MMTVLPAMPVKISQQRQGNFWVEVNIFDSKAINHVLILAPVNAFVNSKQSTQILSTYIVDSFVAFHQDSTLQCTINITNLINFLAPNRSSKIHDAEQFCVSCFQLHWYWGSDPKWLLPSFKSLLKALSAVAHHNVESSWRSYQTDSFGHIDSKYQ